MALDHIGILCSQPQPLTSSCNKLVLPVIQLVTETKQLEISVIKTGTAEIKAILLFKTVYKLYYITEFTKVLVTLLRIYPKKLQT